MQGAGWETAKTYIAANSTRVVVEAKFQKEIASAALITHMRSEVRRVIILETASRWDCMTISPLRDSRTQRRRGRSFYGVEFRREAPTQRAGFLGVPGDAEDA
jgi:hypothetical protein